MKDRVLVVDDSRDNADSLVRLLNILGYEAKPVYDGQQAIDIAAEFQCPLYDPQDDKRYDEGAA